MNNIKASITKGNSNVRVAQAVDSTGEPVAIVPIENVLVINGFSVNPKASPHEAQQAGDAITAEAAKSARLEGVSKIWIVVSDQYDGPNVHTIRVVQEEVPQGLANHRIGFYSPVPPVTYLN